MNELHLPWLELTILFPLLGALFVSTARDAELAQRRSILFFVGALLCAVGAWIDFGSLHTRHAHDHWDLMSRLWGPNFLSIDELSAPLLPLAALMYLLTAGITLRTKMQRFSFSWSLVSEALLLALLSCKNPWGIVVLLSLGTLPPLFELRSRRKPTRVYVLHMGLFVILLVSGWYLVSRDAEQSLHSIWPAALLTAAVLLRSGIAPVHCWMTDLFEHATFGTALLFVTPMAGAYAAVYLVLPVAPDWALRSIAILSLVTAVYSAGMAVVQTEARRFFCYLFLSHSSLVLVGLETATPISLTGALSLWLSVGLALTGFGLTLRAIESRVGRLAMNEYHGLYDHIPMLASLFLMTGLASVGFPLTFGFVGVELLVDGAVQEYPVVGILVVVAAALNSIAVVQAYFRVFTGKRRAAAFSFRARRSERFAVLALTALILGGGLWPQPGVSSRYRAAMEVVQSRRQVAGPEVKPLPLEHQLSLNGFK
jgi:NADH-quinone oxidoreductase subunit M